jgi:hypothetical protein
MRLPNESMQSRSHFKKQPSVVHKQRSSILLELAIEAKDDEADRQ